jgi:large subunit ribosomal protein L18
MSVKITSRKIARLSRRKRIRKHVNGTPERPRLVVFRSLNHIYVQLVDDESHKTLLSVSDLTKEVSAALKAKMTKTEKSSIVGKVIAQRALEQKIKKVVFDRSGYIYHGRIKALADAAREAGLEF